MSDWEANKGLAQEITADYFKLRELRDAMVDTPTMCKVLVRSNIMVDHYQVMVHAMALQETVIAARLRLNLHAYETLTNVARSDPYNGPSDAEE